ncbi:MAG TPA: alpha/beta hydrolase [Dehalococcoidia bacterium]|nr:alpha/beta hydrolase [Dehalococcoidia bacterium]
MPDGSPTGRPLVQPAEGELKLNGLRIHYFEWQGRGERPLVLLHGLRDYAYYWQDCANRLLDDFHVYAFDQRGHGESEHAPGGYLVWALASDLTAFADARSLERFDLLGLSLGSRCAMAFARESWPRLGHLVLVDMGPQMARVGARGLKDDMTAKAEASPSSFSRAQAVEFFSGQWPSLDATSLDRLIANALSRGEDPDASGGLYSNRYDRRLADITTKAAIPEIAFLWDSLTRVQCPTLVLRGEHSPILDDEISSRMVQSLPNGRLYVFKDTGHSLPRLRPERFAAVVRAFLLDEPLPE